MLNDNGSEFYVYLSTDSPGENIKSFLTTVHGCRPGFVGAYWIFLMVMATADLRWLRFLLLEPDSVSRT